MTTPEVHVYDAFASAPGGGNRAGVVVGPPFDPDDRQALAAELAVPTTAFVSVHERPGTWAARFFTPTREIDMCGHAIVAMFSTLSDTGRLGVASRMENSVLTAKGHLHVSINQRPPQRPLVALHLPVATARGSAPPLPAIHEALGLGIDALHPDLPVEVWDGSLSHLVVPIAHFDALADLEPDFGALAGLSDTWQVDTIAAFAAHLDSPTLLRVRDLCPGIGNPEEAASGTTNAVLGCYLVAHAKHAGIDPTSRTVSLRAEQGVEMGSPSLIHTQVHMSAKHRIIEVWVRGDATVVAHGAAT